MIKRKEIQKSLLLQACLSGSMISEKANKVGGIYQDGIEDIYDSIGSCGECYYAVNDCTLCEYHTKADADGDIFEFDIQNKEYYCGSFKRKET